MNRNAGLPSELHARPDKAEHAHRTKVVELFGQLKRLLQGHGRVHGGHQRGDSVVEDPRGVPSQRAAQADGRHALFRGAPALALALAFLFIRLRYGAERFPYLLDRTDTEIIVIDDTLTKNDCARISEQVQAVVQAHNYSKHTAFRAALFTEEICLTILEKNANGKKRS